jgi:hypothetical protein
MIRKRSDANLGKRVRRIVASATAFIFLCQNFAWAVCADGTTFPASGFVAGQAPAVNWSPNTFTFTRGSIFVPDTSVFEHNDPAQPSTGGGHNWVFDQGSTLCKETDIGPAGGTPTAWAIPDSASLGCIQLPTGKGGVLIGCCIIPLPGQAITPTCNPALLSQPGAPNPANTRFNQLGCAISHGVATSPQTATTFLFVIGNNGNLVSFLFVVALTNVANPVSGGDAGKIANSLSWYSDIPDGQKLTYAAVSPDGMFAIATSNQKSPSVYACLNPLGDPGDPSLPIDPNFSVLPTFSNSQVKCMQVVNNNLAVDSTTAFGPDNQPYFGGQPGVNSVNSDPGGSAATAWPQCIFNNFGFGNPAPTTLMGKLQAVFNAHSANHCGNAQANIGFMTALVAQPPAIISRGSYMYASTGNRVVQFKVTVDPVSGLSHYAFRTYLTGLSGVVTGLGVADDLKSVMTFTDPTGLGLAGQEAIVKLPLCEDM